jgi:hypothetical protein
VRKSRPLIGGVIVLFLKALHTLALLNVRDLAPGTGWGRVPTPMF